MFHKEEMCSLFQTSIALQQLYQSLNLLILLLRTLMCFLSNMKWNHRNNILLCFVFPINHVNVANCLYINQNDLMTSMDGSFLFLHSSLESLGRMLMNRFLNHAPRTTSSLEIPGVHPFNNSQFFFYD